MENIQGVHEFFEDKKLIAKIDNSDFNRIVVTLIDKPEPYVQRFFVRNKFHQLVSDTKMMRKIGIKSL